MVKATLRIDDDKLQSLPSSITEDDDRNPVEERDWGGSQERGIGVTGEERGCGCVSGKEGIQCSMWEKKNVWFAELGIFGCVIQAKTGISWEENKRDSPVPAKKRESPPKGGFFHKLMHKIHYSFLSSSANSRKNGSLVEQQVGRAQARVDELQKKVNELEQKLQSQRKEKGNLESRVNEAEEKINGLLSEIENTGKANDEQETKIRKTEHALEVKVAEVEMWKAKFEALNEVNELERELQSQRTEKGDLKDRLNEAEKKIDDLLSKIENVNELEEELQLQRIEKGDLKDLVNEAEKKIDDLLSKIENVNEFENELQSQRIEKGDLKDRVNEAEKKINDLLSKIENKWILAIKEQWMVVKDTVELHVKSLSTKTIEVYEVSKTTLAPHVIKAQVDPYFQEAKKFGKLYVDQLTTVTKPHVDKAVTAYKKFLKSASTYHHQVQGTVKGLLKRHELARPLATKELEWFAASALVALLIIILFRIFSSLFCTKSKKPAPGTSHARRKAKRGHPEK
ncbi:hypothetical protein C1H46_027682 [Malus baccata]|uniref:Uncharacterized protein n=1 Tax=Malus baccata TaxID=106549 RepID=A0A540LKF5_MALBA|nr:hypothetical protein C1H46_027682 [Malus baccata]